MSYGASPEDRKVFNQLMTEAENRKCVDCGAPNPQWANIHHAVFICLECAGTHRGLGVHLSFVRSITMDQWKDWKPEKLQRMKVGGNKKALAFFASKDVPGGSKAEIKARYNHIGAFMYRAKLDAEQEGRTWSEANFTAPPEYNPSWDKPPQRTGYAGGGPNRMGGMGSRPREEKASAVDEGLKAVTAGFGKLQAVGWAVGSAVADTSKKAARSVQENARSVDTSNVSKSAEEGWKTASASASAGWGWLSSTVQKAAASAAELVGQDGDDGFGAIRSNLATGPVGEGDTIVVGETVVWQSPQGPQKVVVSAVDDRSDPPTYILKLEDGGKRGASHDKLRKWAKYQHESGGGAAEQEEETPQPQPQPQRSSPKNANPFAAQQPRPVQKRAAAAAPQPAKPAQDDDEDSGWDDDSWGKD